MIGNAGAEVSGLAPPSVDLDRPEPPEKVPRPRHVHLSARHRYDGAFSWPPRFFDDHQGGFSRSWENSPYIDLLSYARELEGNDISIFLRTEENWAPDQQRVDSVLDITREATIQNLLDRDERAQKEKIALLIDGNASGPGPHLRDFLGGLTAQALYDELSKKRYSEDGDDSVVDTDRRLIYVANLDAWGIMALVGTSPESLFRVLGDFVLNYTCANPSIGVSFSIRRHENFIRRVRTPTLDQVPPIPKQRKILEEFDELENGLRYFKEVLDELAQVLQENVRSGELFMKTDVLYFRNYDEPSDDASICFPYLAQIRKTFTNLEQLRQRLGDMQQKCKEMVEEVASVRKMHRQQLNILTPVHYSPTVLAWITILTFPLIITAALFSCDDIFIFKRSWKSFLLVWLVITVIVLAIAAIRVWLFQSQKTPDNEIEGSCNPLNALDSQEKTAADQITQEVPRCATLFTGVIGVFQKRGVGKAVAENPRIRDQIIALETCGSR
ncbi:uncharacterized protein GLRG_09673 [Colletotrichum graminicola M1.001]|uniref:CorA-like Mg2+ transporter n=1 Tax=Colletotrichum graminicola (strain M1.001 / M2 / FGSC 10212) TaxID=645133 RepID=E3QUJ1_COLGM|nr:uncharacterized protein GLRG_09673 [Colletotrichum graminicola M1.001]EFQ34529.1 hypothetical protein GLRG_09673 [Colletotrichum graminicola M1.001]